MTSQHTLINNQEQNHEILQLGITSTKPLSKTEKKRQKLYTEQEKSLSNPFLNPQHKPSCSSLKGNLLAQEYSLGRISYSAYCAGLYLQKKLYLNNRASLSGNNWSNNVKVDQSRDPEATMLFKLQCAQEISRIIDDIQPIIGILGIRLLRLILGEDLSFSQATSQLGKKGDLPKEKQGKHVTSLYAWQFRQSLEALGEHWNDWQQHPNLKI